MVETCGEARNPLRREPDLRHQHEGLRAGCGDAIDDIEIDLRLAAVGDTLEHEGRVAGEPRADPLDCVALRSIERDGMGRRGEGADCRGYRAFFHPTFIEQGSQCGARAVVERGKLLGVAARCGLQPAQERGLWRGSVCCYCPGAPPPAAVSRQYRSATSVEGLPWRRSAGNRVAKTSPMVWWLLCAVHWPRASRSWPFSGVGFCAVLV